MSSISKYSMSLRTESKFFQTHSFADVNVENHKQNSGSVDNQIN